jgi:ribonuclease Z
MTKTAIGVVGCLLGTAATLFLSAPCAQAAPCLTVTLTGTQSGPPVVNGLAGAGTLVRYGDDSNDCGTVKLQFDAGRGTNMRLSQVGVAPGQLNAIFFTHMHLDHTLGFADIALLRWHFNSTGPKLDVVCSSDAVSPLGVTVSCRKFVAHIGDVFIQSGEIAYRRSDNSKRLPGGPVQVTNVMTFDPSNEPQVVWSSGDVRVTAIRSAHMPGHASYRVDTPAGSVVIGGDAGNDTAAPPRTTSTSDQVERLAKGVDIIVHTNTHPVMAPEGGSGMPPPIFHRQSATTDLGAMAKRVGAKYLMLTHLNPPLGAKRQGPYTVPGGPLTEADYRKAVEASGFTGNIVVGTDLATVRIPAK